MPIYCDESGYTGYNLLVEEQPYFVYAALHLEESEADHFRNHLKEKYKLQGNLKGANLIQSNPGQNAISELYAAHSERVKIVFHHKKYSLACKYFEYVFEPAISDYSTMFYKEKFNRFIASLVYMAFSQSSSKAEDLFTKFQDLLRGNDFNGLFDLLKDKNIPNDLISMVAQFTILHKDSTLDDITTDGKIDYWILDLAQSALYNLLCLWSIDLGELNVICDQSQPLKEVVDRVALFRELHQKIVYADPLGNGKMALNFSLKDPISFQSSKKSCGLQLADLFASSVYWYLTNPSANNGLSKTIDQYLPKIIVPSEQFCIQPQPDLYLTPGSIEFAFGVTALNKLTEFSKKSPENAARMFVDYLRESIAKQRSS